jgi:hypothetical protein
MSIVYRKELKFWVDVTSHKLNIDVTLIFALFPLLVYRFPIELMGLILPERKLTS